MNTINARLKTILIWLFLAFPLSGCMTFHQTVTKKDPLIDQTSTSAVLASKKYRRIMVIPPSADTKGGSFEENLASAEREFLARGMTLTSPAITGRVYQGDSGKAARASLTDMERALILAKDSNTEALLQIGTFKWKPIAESKLSQRYFVAERNEDSSWFSFFPQSTFREVGREEYVETEKHKIVMSAGFLSFTGRLVDVEDGEVVASFSLHGLLVRNLPQDYKSELVTGDTKQDWHVVNSNFDFSGEWQRDAKRDLRDKVFSRIADTIVGGN